MRTGWTWASASVIGTAHIKSNTRKQDAGRALVLPGESDLWVGVVSDGAGSASHGGEGASLITRIMTEQARLHWLRSPMLPQDEEVDSWMDAARDAILMAAKRRALSPRDFAATLIMVLSTGARSIVIQVGDGCAAMCIVSSDEWRVPLWPDHGEYASTTSFVTDEPVAKVRFAHVDESVSAVILLTDGLERLALDFSKKIPFRGFFEAMSEAVSNGAGSGRNIQLSSQLAQYLASDSICTRTDDDKTLITAIFG